MRNTVVLTRDGMAEARAIRDHLARVGYRVLTVPPDIRLWDEAALSAFAAPLADALAGVVHPAPERTLAAVEAVDADQWNRAADEGPMAAWCVTKVFCGLMRAAGGGSMIYLDSIHAEKPVGYGALFSMGCAATQMLAREAAQDYGASGVRVYFIQKGVSDADPDSRSPVSTLYYGADARCAGRALPGVDALNALTAFLLTPGAAPLSGSDLRADGGMTLFYLQRLPAEGGARHE